MSEREIWACPFGLMNDLICCYLIHHNMAREAGPVDDEAMIPDLA